MEQRRTDLALEARELWQERAGETSQLEGVEARTGEREGFLSETVHILDERGEQALGKPAGTYVTLTMDGLQRREEDAFGRAARALAAELGCAVAQDNRAAAAQAEYIVLCVKPQMMEELLAPLRFTLAERPSRFVLCSMAAGLSIARIQEMAGSDCPVIRIMPNTPASVGAGMIQYCTSNVTAEEEAEFLKLMAPAGRLDAVPEGLIDAASCVSGCGPAWVYQFIEALADGGVACGLPRAKAQEYAAQMVLGSAKLVLESGQHPGALKDAVCSPGGSTIQGVRVLEEKGLRGAVMDAVIASYNKTKEMGKG